MAQPLLRIFSDLHYGDPASTLTSLAALTPLFDGASQIVLNGDTLDTRPSPVFGSTAPHQARAEVLDFFQHSAPPATLLTGNHDPDLTDTHWQEFSGQQLFVIHGDALFEDIVPWSRDAPLARSLLVTELAKLPAEDRTQLDSLMRASRRAAALIPQRHQAETRRLKQLAGLLNDTIWPPTRIFRILRAWYETPHRAEAFARRHAPQARFFAMGHTHRLGAQRTRSGLVLLNTGSFCPPGGSGVIEVTDDRITLRRIDRRSGEYRLGASLAEFSLAKP